MASKIKPIAIMGNDVIVGAYYISWDIHQKKKPIAIIG